MSVAHGWNYSRLTDWVKQMLVEERIGRITSISGYMASCLTDLFSGRTGYGVIEVAGFPVEAESATWARADAGGGYLYGQLSHLLGLGLWLVPHDPEEVFARARLLENGVDLDIQVSVRLEGGVIASFNGQGHQPWARRHMCDLRIAGDEGVIVLDFDRVQAQMMLQGDKEQAEVLYVEPHPPAEDDDWVYTCDGPAQLLVDVCLGRSAADRAPVRLGVATVAVMEAAWRSAHTGAPVRVEELRS